MPYTEQEARDMIAAINLAGQKDAQQAQALFNANKQTALNWWDTVKPAIPTTRQQALDAYNYIKNLLITQTDEFRKIILREKLEQANEKFKEIKALGN